jgi:hypothetical protein
MRKITIGFSRSTKKFAIGSILIRWYMGTPYSHVYLRFESPAMERSLIYEAVGSGVRFVGFEKWKQHAKEVDSFEIWIEDENYKKLMQFCIDQAGDEYGFMQNLGIVWANIVKSKKNPLTSGENCSEAMGEVMELEGFDVNKDFNLLTPKDIHQILSTKLLSRLPKPDQESPNP